MGFFTKKSKNETIKKLSIFTRVKDFGWKLICESDERYPDLTRVGLVVALLSAVGMAAYSVFWLAKDLSFSDFCIGMSTLLAGGGTGIGMRAKLEDGTGSASEAVLSKVDMAKEKDREEFKQEIKGKNGE